MIISLSCNAIEIRWEIGKFKLYIVHIPIRHRNPFNPVKFTSRWLTQRQIKSKQIKSTNCIAQSRKCAKKKCVIPMCWSPKKLCSTRLYSAKLCSFAFKTSFFHRELHYPRVHYFVRVCVENPSNHAKNKPGGWWLYVSRCTCYVATVGYITWIRLLFPKNDVTVLAKITVCPSSRV